MRRQLLFQPAAPLRQPHRFRCKPLRVVQLTALKAVRQAQPQSSIVGSPALVSGVSPTAALGSASPAADGPWTGPDDHRSPPLGVLATDTPGTEEGNLYTRGREVSIGPLLSTDVATMLADSVAATIEREEADTALTDADATKLLPECAVAPPAGLAIRVGSGGDPSCAQQQLYSADVGNGGGQAMGATPLPDSPMQSVSSPASRGSSRRSQSGESGSLRSRLHPRSVIGKMAGALSFGHRSPTLDPLTTNGALSGTTDSPTAAQLRRALSSVVTHVRMNIVKRRPLACLSGPPRPYLGRQTTHNRLEVRLGL